MTVMVAHRVGSLRNCHAIFVLEEGRIVARGTYAELLEDLSAFRALAATSPTRSVEVAGP